MLLYLGCWMLDASLCVSDVGFLDTAVLSPARTSRIIAGLDRAVFVNASFCQRLLLLWPLN